MSFTGRSSNFMGSGLFSALNRAGRKVLLVITNEPRMRRAWYERLNIGGGITGMWCPAVIDADTNDHAPFTRAYQTVAEISYSPSAWPYRHDGQPGAPSVYRAYPYDTGATAMDLTAGLPADFCPGGFREAMWSAGTPIGADAEIFRASLDTSTYTAAVNPTWYQDQLTVKAVWHGPAENATGANPIAGSPGLVAACWRGAGAPTLGTSAGSSTNAGIFSNSVTLAAGSGAPRGAIYCPVDEAFSALGCRACLLGVWMRSDTAANGIDLVVIDTPTLQNLDMGIAAGQGTAGGGSDGNGGGFTKTAIDALATALGVTFSAVVLDFSAGIGAGFANLSFQDDTTDFAGGAGAPNPLTEFTTDVCNTLRQATCIGQAPICLVSGHFYGHMNDSSLTLGPSYAVAATMRRTVTNGYSWMAARPNDTHDGVVRGCTLNFYDYGGSDGQSSPNTQNTILASGVIETGLADSSKIKGAYSAATNYAAGDGVYDTTDGVNAYGATRWFKCLLANGPSTTVRATSNATYWQPLDFRPKTALAASKVDLFVSELRRNSNARDRSRARPIGGVR